MSPSDDAQTTPVHMRPCYRCQRYIIHFWQWEPDVVPMREELRETELAAKKANRENQHKEHRELKAAAKLQREKIADYIETHPQDLGMHVCVYCAAERWQKNRGRALFDVEISALRH